MDPLQFIKQLMNEQDDFHDEKTLEKCFFLAQGVAD